MLGVLNYDMAWKKTECLRKIAARLDKICHNAFARKLFLA